MASRTFASTPVLSGRHTRSHQKLGTQGDKGRRRTRLSPSDHKLRYTPTSLLKGQSKGVGRSGGTASTSSTSSVSSSVTTVLSADSAGSNNLWQTEGTGLRSGDS